MTQTKKQLIDEGFANGNFYSASKDCKNDLIKNGSPNSLKTWRDLPKTWRGLCEAALVEQIEVITDVVFDDNDVMSDESSAVSGNLKLAKSALAFLKIYQLIREGYGKNIEHVEWIFNKYASNKSKWMIIDNYDKKKFQIVKVKNNYTGSQLVFRTKKQAEEFLKHQENIQLLKDYFMI